MNPFGNFKFNQYQQQFAPLPARDIIQSSNQLHQEALRNEASMDKLKQLANQINVLDEDAYIKKAQLDELDRIIAEAEKTGAWEHAGKMARESARNFANNRQLASAQQNYAKFQALLKEANEMDVSDFQRAKIKHLRNTYQGAGSADEFGNYNKMVPVNLYEEHDIMQEVFDNLAKKKADGSVVPYKEGYWLVTATNEIRSEQELHEDGVNWVMSQPKYRTQIRDMVMHRATGGDLSKDITQEDYKKTYNQVVSELVAPSAGILEYQKQGLSYKADPMAVHRGKKALDALDQNIVTSSEVVPHDVPTFKENSTKLREAEANLKELKSRVSDTQDDELESSINTAQEEVNRLNEVVNQELNNLADEINEIAGFEGDNKITVDQLKIEFEKQHLQEDIDKINTTTSNRNLRSSIPGLQGASTYEDKESKEKRLDLQRRKDSLSNNLNEKQSEAFNYFMGKDRPFASSRMDQYEESKTKSRDSQVVLMDVKESKAFAPYINTEMLKGGARRLDGSEIDQEEIAGYQIDPNGNVGLVAQDYNGRKYIEVPVVKKTKKGEVKETIRVDASRVNENGGTLYSAMLGQLDKKVRNIEANMEYLTPYEQQQAQTLVTASRPLLNPEINEYTNFYNSANNLKRKGVDVRGSNTGQGYGSVETNLGQNAFIEIKNVGQTGTEIYIGSKDDAGNKYVFSFDNNQGHDKYGSQNGIVKEFLNVEGTLNPRSNTNNTKKAERTHKLGQAIDITNNLITTSSDQPNFHVMSKISTYDNGGDVNLTRADLEQAEEIVYGMSAVLEEAGYQTNIMDFNINNAESVKSALSTYNQLLQLVAEEQ